MSPTLQTLLARLSDGHFHSGEALGKELGLGRGAVWKALRQLDELGLELQAVQGRGYRLATALPLLDVSAIRNSLGLIAEIPTPAIDLFMHIDSTSDYLKEKAEGGAASGHVCLAEHQTQGRGRRGHHWHSPFGSNIYLSVLWRFSGGISVLGGLGLVVAVALMRTLKDLNVVDVGIKWPNDILAPQGKLAGILVDAAGESGGPCYAVIGIGLNYAMSEAQRSRIDQPCSSLVDLGVDIGRNTLSGLLLRQLFSDLGQFDREGLTPFLHDWRRWDCLRDKTICLHQPTAVVTGTARGIDENGLLCVEHDGATRRYAAGEVSLSGVAT